MKVITIKQPFASLIANGIKEYEFRTWKTKYRGKLLIQASKGVDKKAMKKFEMYNLEYPTDDEARKMLLAKNDIVYHHVCTDMSYDGYGFKLENVKRIEPIYVSGKLGLWDYDYEE